MESREDLEKKLRDLEARREALLADLEWRIPDVAGEKDKLAEMKKAVKKGELVDVGVQATIVEVLAGVLRDRQMELDWVEGELTNIKNKLQKLEFEEKHEGSKRGRA